MTIIRHRGSRMSRSLPIEYFVLTGLRYEGEVIGYVADLPIRETVIDARGTRYHFAGIASRDRDGRFNVDLLQPGEWVVQPGLIYAAEKRSSSTTRLRSFVRTLKLHLPARMRLHR